MGFISCEWEIVCCIPRHLLRNDCNLPFSSCLMLISFSNTLKCRDRDLRLPVFIRREETDKYNGKNLWSKSATANTIKTLIPYAKSTDPSYRFSPRAVLTNAADGNPLMLALLVTFSTLGRENRMAVSVELNRRHYTHTHVQTLTDITASDNNELRAHTDTNTNTKKFHLKTRSILLLPPLPLTSLLDVDLPEAQGAVAAGAGEAPAAA